MSSPSPAPDHGPVSRRPWWIWASIVGIVVVLALIIWVVAAALPSGRHPDADSSSSPSVSASSTPAPLPSTTPSPRPTTVPIDKPGSISAGLDASIQHIEAVQGVAKGPGEVSGPSIRFSVVIANGTASAVDLHAIVVTVDYGSARTPALQLYSPGATTMPTSVAPGKTASAVYIFSVPVAQRNLVHITVDYSVDVAPLVFVGAVPKA